MILKQRYINLLYSKENKLYFCKEYIDINLQVQLSIDEALLKTGGSKQRYWRNKGENIKYSEINIES